MARSHLRRTTNVSRPTNLLGTEDDPDFSASGFWRVHRRLTGPDFKE
jgi:hypothetical protein